MSSNRPSRLKIAMSSSRRLAWTTSRSAASMVARSVWVPRMSASIMPWARMLTSALARLGRIAGVFRLMTGQVVSAADVELDVH
jgi:hypothetical protein